MVADAEIIANIRAVAFFFISHISFFCPPSTWCMGGTMVLESAICKKIASFPQSDHIQQKRNFSCKNIVIIPRISYFCQLFRVGAQGLRMNIQNAQIYSCIFVPKLVCLVLFSEIIRYKSNFQMDFLCKMPFMRKPFVGASRYFNELNIYESLILFSWILGMSVLTHEKKVKPKQGKHHQRNSGGVFWRD